MSELTAAPTEPRRLPRSRAATRQLWVERLLNHFHKAVWLNPVPQKHWDYTQSVGILRRLFGGRMFPLTLEGIDGAMRELVR